MKKIMILIMAFTIMAGSVSSQSLDDISKKVYDLSIEAINKGMNRMSAYEEYLEKQELEEALEAKQDAEEQRTLDDMYHCLIPTRGELTFTRCFCPNISEYTWVHTLIVDNKLWISCFSDDDGELGSPIYLDEIRSYKVTEFTEKPAIEMELQKDILIFTQSATDTYKFDIHDGKQ